MFMGTYHLRNASDSHCEFATRGRSVKRSRRRFSMACIYEVIELKRASNTSLTRCR